ncbi:contractile injection system protein, VgrG/Pvc8 family [Paenibacillus sp. PL2-23]|uniref:phage late control D family protein n=1 Tax=Paenibacillus sp. PL2-23 TaxID=2100729 RepID=UPI0030F7FA16
MQYKYSDLETKYSGFNAPECELLFDGSSSAGQMAIGWIEVEQSTYSEADIARFKLIDIFTWNPPEVKWIKSKIKLGGSLQVKMGYADKKGLVFEGIITGYTIEYPSDESPYIIVTAMDKSILMMKSAHSKVWTESKVSDVVREIAGDYSLSAAVDDTGLSKKVVEQIGVSDYHFVQSLANDHDYLFYVRGSKLYFQKITASGEPVLELLYGQSLRHFSLQADISGQIGTVKVMGYDIDKKEAIVGESASVEAIGGGSKSGPSYAAALSKKKTEIVYTQADSLDEAKGLAKAMLSRSARDLVRGSGSCTGVPELQAGKMIKITGIGEASWDQTLLLVKTTHRLDADEGYITYFEAEGNSI